MKKYVYNRKDGNGAMKFHVEVPYNNNIYLFGVQEINNNGHFKEIGLYKGIILSEKIPKMMPTKEEMDEISIDDKKHPPQEVIDIAIQRGVPSKILFP